jgi:hypothetical protein
LVPPVAEATVPPARFPHITCISPVSWSAQRAGPTATKHLTWRFDVQGAASPAPASELRTRDRCEFGTGDYQDLTALLSGTYSGDS